MNKLKHIFLFLILFISYNTLSYCQQGSAKKCINAEPLCASTLFSYPNTSGINFAEIGPDYGCVSVAVNPAWFYFQMASDGDIQLKISQSTVLNGTSDLDVDFIAYGPFNNPVLPCEMDLQAINIADCSFKPDFVEYLKISNAMAGDYYLLLITNYSINPGFINVEQTLGTATTNCNVLKETIKSNEIACEGVIITLDTTTTNGTQYIWYKDDGFGNFNTINGVNTASYDVTTTNVYRVDAFNSNNVFLERYEFNTTFYKTPNLPATLQAYTICDTQGENDGIGQFDLNTKDVEVLNGLKASEFLVTYYDNPEDANLGANALPKLYTNSLQTETIYVRVENIMPNGISCYEVGSFNIQVDLLPEFELEDEYILCVNTNGTEEIPTPPVIDTWLSILDYNFVWSLNDTILFSENDGFILAFEAGTYSVEVTDRISGCTNRAITAVVLSQPPEVSAEVVSYAFIEENDIEVTASGIGIQDYEFSLDNGPWQTNASFENVSIGEHSITVRNLSGCGKTIITIMVMDYPKFFTPNGDGIHDTWNIVGIQNQLQAKIYIYDRYGKLMKQLSPNGQGWDGTFNGVKMPSNDYWFTVTYLEPRDNSMKKFKSHFALKR